MRGVLIEESGPLTTIQDCGRRGFRRYGIPVSGAMDTFAMQLANTLTGNPPENPVLEATLAGPVLNFISPCRFAVTGAPCDLTLNGSPVSQWRSIRAGRNAILKIGTATAGARIYIAFSGGIPATPVMGSCSTYLRGSFGGINGRELRKGDIISLDNHVSSWQWRKKVPERLIPEYPSEVTLDILPAIHFSQFSESWKNFIFQTSFSVSARSDRMGIRLTPETGIPCRPPGDIISCGIHYGAIQVPGDGNPVIMGADAQTTGGYPQFANVITPHLDKVGQLRPGNNLRFNLVDYQTSVEKLRERVSFLATFR